MAPPLTMEKVITAANKLGLDVLSKVVKTAHSDYRYRHRGCGFEFSARHNNIHNGKGCPRCGREKQAQKRRLPLEEAKRTAKIARFRLLEEEYHNAHTKMRYQCVACGIEALVSHNAMQRPYRCPGCHDLPRAITPERFLAIATSRPMKILGFGLNIHGKTVAKTQCPDCGHRSDMTLAQFARVGCRPCRSVEGGQKQRIPLAVRLEAAERQGFELIDASPVRANDRIHYRCKKRRHDVFTSHKLVLRGDGCPECANFAFIGESFARRAIELAFGKKFAKSRPHWLTYKGRQLELDGFNEELGVAFEHQGGQHDVFVKHWHKTVEKFEDLKRRDRAKARKCREHGVVLIIVPNLTSRSTKEEKLYTIREAIEKALPGRRLKWKAMAQICIEELGDERLLVLIEKLNSVGLRLEVEEYLGAVHKHNVVCQTCGYRSLVAPDKVRPGRRCLGCHPVMTESLRI